MALGDDNDPLADFRDIPQAGTLAYAPPATMPNTTGFAPPTQSVTAPVVPPPAVSGANDFHSFMQSLPPSTGGLAVPPPVAPSRPTPTGDPRAAISSMLPGVNIPGVTTAAPAPFALPRPTQNDETPESKAFWQGQNNNFAPMTQADRVAGIERSDALWRQNAPQNGEGFEAPVPFRSPVPDVIDQRGLKPEQKLQLKQEQQRAEGFTEFLTAHPDVAKDLGITDMRNLSQNDILGHVAAYKAAAAIGLAKQKADAETQAEKDKKQAEADRLAGAQLRQQNFDTTRSDRLNQQGAAAAATQGRFDQTEADKANKPVTAPKPMKMADGSYAVYDAATNSLIPVSSGATKADSLIDKYLK